MDFKPTIYIYIYIYITGKTIGFSVPCCHSIGGHFRWSQLKGCRALKMLPGCEIGIFHLHMATYEALGFFS